jgi:hypothetical protein
MHVASGGLHIQILFARAMAPRCGAPNELDVTIAADCLAIEKPIAWLISGLVQIELCGAIVAAIHWGDEYLPPEVKLNTNAMVRESLSWNRRATYLFVNALRIASSIEWRQVMKYR